jgi:hypothetical protein
MKLSRYKLLETRSDNRKNLGFKYEGQIFKRSMSSYMFLDPMRSAILAEYEKVFHFALEKVKSIKTFFNYSVDRDEKNIN